MNGIEFVLPEDIEKRSFEIIEQELSGREIGDKIKPVVMRVIHTTADFEYFDNLKFSENVIDKILELIHEGVVFVTDTNMALSGINKSALRKLGCEAYCFMSDSDVASSAKSEQTTRAAASVDKAAAMGRKIIYVVGNAPTALVRLFEHIQKGDFIPAAVIGAPVGFVNVVRSKELIMNTDVPYIVAEGRKGGSGVAAAICNALLYMAGGRAV
ncbi:MAG: precorrin-8X methylmutase [Ruminococcus flavefaciens]|nr:precorrin-8X methylmutase [Ruminococcus flavefaciens]MCM1059949.1 precorrin-8X methylmutase [Eubacterium sp.]